MRASRGAFPFPLARLLGGSNPTLAAATRQTTGLLKINFIPLLRPSPCASFSTSSRTTHHAVQGRLTAPATQKKGKDASLGLPKHRAGGRNAERKPVEAEEAAAEEGGKEVVSTKKRNVLPSADGAYRLVERLAKRIARSGLCSRREAERLIGEGLVSVDGVVVKSPAVNVTPASVVTINNKKLEKTPPPQVWMHYKKRGVLVTHHDPQGREALFPHLRRMGLPHLVSVGRLDYTSEGLLLLTNNGRLAQYLEHPSNEYQRKYKVRIRGRVEQKVIDRLAKGITVGGVEYGPIKVTPIEKRRAEEEQSTNEWVYVSLTEGKNREIRRVFEHFKLVVTRLIRVQYGPYKLDKALEPGDVVETGLRLDLVKKADKYWWLWDGDKESSAVPFPESYFRIDPRKIVTSLPSPGSAAKSAAREAPALSHPAPAPSSTSDEPLPKGTF